MREKHPNVSVRCKICVIILKLPTWLVGVSKSGHFYLNKMFSCNCNVFLITNLSYRFIRKIVKSNALNEISIWSTSFVLKTYLRFVR